MLLVNDRQTKFESFSNENMNNDLFSLTEKEN